ncbi:MAG: 2-amino-4-hydroxy-6-hydroxymethyldihydropteridine diphosphokinase [Chromatiales bacterium]|jgi:2-amino-4-hydroxy-6-hydroxymethyldihydropteridine diphosphokinase
MRQDRVTAYIGLGSNLHNPIEQLQQALAALDHMPHTKVKKVSSFYRSAPLGPAGQPDYVNAVAQLDTELSASELLQWLHSIEDIHGRERMVRWGARTLDLDILLYDDLRIDLPHLHIPHREMANRAFVLQPLLEIAAGDLPIPGQGTLQQLVDACPDSRIEKLAMEHSPS